MFNFTTKARLIILLVVGLMGIGAPEGAFAQQHAHCRPRSGQITIFEHANYRGNCAVLRAGSYYTIDHINAAAGLYGSARIRNDSISSVLVGSGVSATLYEHINLRGDRSTFTSSDSNLSGNRVGNDQTSSVVVRRTSTPPARPRPRVRRVSIEGAVLGGRMPSWVPDPPRGSITFNKDTEINATGRITARLDFRNADGSKWQSTTPIKIMNLRGNERLCKITRAGHDIKYWLGFQAHCASSNACSYNIERNTLWATIGKVDVVLAPAGVQCP